MKKKTRKKKEHFQFHMENTDGRVLLQQYQPVNLLNPMALTLPYPNAYQDAYYVPFQNPNPVQSWDSNSQNDVIHPPGVEPATVTHISSGCGTLPPVPGYTYLQTQAIASSSTSIPHYYHDPSVRLALAPFGTGITEPATVTENLVPTNITSSLLINQKDGPQNRGIRKKGPKKIKTVQSAWCAFCKVDCNSKSVLDQHKLGRKHKKNLKKLIAENACVLTQCLAVTPAQAPASADIPAPTTLALPPTVSSALVTENACVLTQCLAATPAQAPASADIPAPTTLVLPPTVSTVLVTGPNGNLDATKPEIGQKARNKVAGNEDLETKRKKLLEGGVAAKDVRMCTICSVVCNSEMVFMNHLAGQKHATMMKKSASTTGMAVTT